MEFKDAQEGLEQFNRRVAIAGGFVLFCFALLFGRFVWLQVIQHDYYQTRAEDNRISLVPIVPNRGLIIDRNGEVLARNYSAYTLEITPTQVADLEATIDGLAEFIDIQPRDRKRFRKLMEESRRIDSLPIRTRLTDAEVAKFIARRYRFPGVDIKARLFRQYPQGAFASHVLGYIGRITDRDLARIEERGQEANYRGTDHFGKTGLEQYYEFELHGTSGFEKVEVDAGGRPVRTLARTAPIPGNNLILTIDARLQQIAEQAFGDRKGSLVAIDPTSGAILALVSMPNYDPNLFVDGIGTADWEALNNAPEKPMVNRALNGAYPPGSTFKPFMALAGLHYGKRRAEQAIADPGFYVFGGHTFGSVRNKNLGMVDLYWSIVKSSNVYYYTLANELGIDRIAEFMSWFGFGARTGVDIEGEASGVLPSQEWKKRRYKRADQQKWHAGETISVGVGQGYNAYTPMQLAHAMATLANGGTIFQPRLVNAIVDARTGKETRVEPRVVRSLPVKPEHIEAVRQAMAGTTVEGTAARAFAGAGYASGGKTGTAQVFSLRGQKYDAHALKEEMRDHSLYVAFAPVDKPRIALAVLVENGGFGAQAAAPIARQVFDYYLLGTLPPGVAPTDEAAREEDQVQEDNP